MKIDLSKIKAKIAQLNGENKNGSSSNVQLWKPGVGEYTIRCLHWPEGVCREGEFAVEKWFYYGIAERSSILAPEQFSKPDPIQELRQKLFKSGTPSDKELAKKLFAKMRSYVPVVVLSGPDANPEKVQVWAFGSQIYQKLLNWFLNEKIGDYFDAEQGFNINVKITKQKGKSFTDTELELAVLDGRGPVADSSEKIQALIKGIPDISKMYQLKDYATIEKELQVYLNGGTVIDSKNDTVGSERGSKAALDDLSELADDVKKEVKKEAKKATPKTVEKKPVVVEDDDVEDSKPTDDLDSAFADLMGDE